MHAAVAAGPQAGGYATITDAAAAMASLKDQIYTPEPAHHDIYEQLYRDYEILHDTLGRGDNNVMKRLRALRSQQGEPIRQSP